MEGEPGQDHQAQGQEGRPTAAGEEKGRREQKKTRDRIWSRVFHGARRHAAPPMLGSPGGRGKPVRGGGAPNGPGVRFPDRAPARRGVPRAPSTARCS